MRKLLKELEQDGLIGVARSPRRTSQYSLNLPGDEVLINSKKTLGRPKRRVNERELLELRAEGKSVREIAAEMRIGYGTARKWLAKSAHIRT